VNLSDASFEDLRSLGMSVTQAKRVLDYRDRLGGFDSIDDLDFVPGFPKSFLDQVKANVTL
jgi:DNA uptake protein ComE-like DNA-binding protein